MNNTGASRVFGRIRASAACSHHLCGKTGQELLSKFSLAGKMDKAPVVMGI